MVRFLAIFTRLYDLVKNLYESDWLGWNIADYRHYESMQLTYRDRN